MLVVESIGPSGANVRGEEEDEIREKCSVSGLSNGPVGS